MNQTASSSQNLGSKPGKAVIVVNNDDEFTDLLDVSPEKITVIDFTASWCGPCKAIAPFFEQLSRKYHQCRFLKVDVDQCPQAAEKFGVNAMPTFAFYRNKNVLEKFSGANPTLLESKVKEFSSSSNQEASDDGLLTDEEKQAKHINLHGLIDSSKSECLNETEEHTMKDCLSPDGYLLSDCDEQLILNITFIQYVKLNSLRIRAPADKGPKEIKIFINQISTPDFDRAESMEPIQSFDLKPEDLKEGAVIPLKYVKFQNVHSVQIFVKNNQNGGEVTQIDDLIFVGSPVNTTNMNDLKASKGPNASFHLHVDM